MPLGAVGAHRSCGSPIPGGAQGWMGIWGAGLAERGAGSAPGPCFAAWGARRRVLTRLLRLQLAGRVGPLLRHHHPAQPAALPGGG